MQPARRTEALLVPRLLRTASVKQYCVPAARPGTSCSKPKPANTGSLRLSRSGRRRVAFALAPAPRRARAGAACAASSTVYSRICAPPSCASGTCARGARRERRGARAQGREGERARGARGASGASSHAAGRPPHLRPRECQRGAAGSVEGGHLRLCGRRGVRRVRAQALYARAPGALPHARAGRHPPPARAAHRLQGAAQRPPSRSRRALGGRRAPWRGGGGRVRVGVCGSRLIGGREGGRGPAVGLGEVRVGACPTERLRGHARLPQEREAQGRGGLLP